MEYTIRKIIEKNGLSVTETSYLQACPSMLDFRLLSGGEEFYRWDDYGLLFKNIVKVNDFGRTVKSFPAFENVEYFDRMNMPYFTNDLEMLKEAVERREKIAVEGGPCLFGTNEVLVSVRLKNGETRLFDYANGKAYTAIESEALSETENLAEYLIQHGHLIEEISLTRRLEKTESVKDYISMPALPYYLFDIKNVLEVNSMDETDAFHKCKRSAADSSFRYHVDVGLCVVYAGFGCFYKNNRYFLWI